MSPKWCVFEVVTSREAKNDQKFKTFFSRFSHRSQFLHALSIIFIRHINHFFIHVLDPESFFNKNGVFVENVLNFETENMKKMLCFVSCF